MSNLEIIKKYNELGFSIIPLKAREKRPAINWTRYQQEHPSANLINEWIKTNSKGNWGIVTGAISGIVVVDIDNLKEFEQSGITFPKTAEAKTSKGSHLFFKHPGFLISNGVKTIFKWFDIRGDGGYVVSPPSIHPDGTKYEWVEGSSPWDIELAELPQWIIEGLNSVNSNATKDSSKNGVVDWKNQFLNGSGEGSRNDTAARMAGHYFGLGMGFEETNTLMNAWNQKNNPPLSKNELKSVIDSIYNREAKKPGKQYVMDTPYIKSFVNEDGEEIYERGSFRHTILADMIREELPLYRNGRYFFYYDKEDGLWKQGAEDKIKLLISEKLGVHSNNSRVSETFNHVVRTTPVDQGGLPFEKDHPYVINLKNGVLDLTTGNFTPQFSSKYFHRIKLPIAYNPQATSEEVDNFLSSVLYEEDIPFINELAASMLAKKMISPALVFLLGSGGNGKSKLLNLFTMLAGQNNTSNIPMEVLQNDRFASAELYMKLLNNCGDIGDGWLSQTDILKTATGGDPLYAQFKGKDPFKFISIAIQMYSANNEPKFRDHSEGLKDRIYPVRMDKRFRGTSLQQVDPLAKIDDYQLSGWLNKLIPVFQELMKNQGKYNMSEGMKQKRDEWFESMDLVSQFIKEECLIQAEQEDSSQELIIQKKDLWLAFQEYLSSSGYTARFTKSSFDRQLLKHGILEAKKRCNSINPVHCFVGVSLIDSSNTPF